MKFGSSQSVTREEDQRFLTGHGRYVDDLAPKDALHCHVFRSPVAHAEITDLDVSEARSAPGVHLVVTAADLAEAGLANAIPYTVIDNEDGSKAAAPRRPILAEGRVRFVGEPVAFIVADSIAAARDAAEAIVFDYDDLEPKLDVAVGGPEIHPEAPENRCYSWGAGDKAAADAAMAAAAHVVTVTVEDNRIMAASMEPRAIFAEMQGERLHICENGQGVWSKKAGISGWLGIDAEQVLVTTPDVGGAFGMKTMHYPEHFLLTFATRTLNRPVRWMADRTESMLSDNAGRDLSCTAELGFDDALKLTAYRLHTVSNLGAYVSGFAQNIQSRLFSHVFPGVYDVQAAYMNNTAVFTNTTQVDAYRGAGRPEAIYVLERAMDHAARVLGIDPMDLRRRSFIRPEQMPYKTAVGELYDSGAFARAMDRAAEEADTAGFAARRAASAAEGKLRGQGLCYYIEAILGQPMETAKIVLTATGAKVFVGTQSAGQGHETVYKQLLRDRLGLDLDQIEIVQGDSDQIAKGGGTGGSRSVTVQGSAIHATSERLLDGLLPFAEEVMGAEDVRFDPEEAVFRAPGSNTVLGLMELAEQAEAQGRGDLLTAEKEIRNAGRSFPNGCHVAEIEIDPDTGLLTIDRYAVVDDLGNLMNPMLVKGQIHGGIAQGAGQAMNERVVFDEDGQLLTATFMDYGMPRAGDFPFFGFHSEPTETQTNILGMKGCGEAGTIGAMAAVANAVQDAVWSEGVKVADMPFTPHRLWHMIQEARTSGGQA
ncbi:xanthine dehydrogenase family protein molybdopterin-binding subunit [Nioella nitratireducens]|uniref:xanthine dehydrogenase family protein molybdopterin-binding subunit n=1 Tax=Nioella nitratireducens TaxID=1287720 RepID=UPI0008FD4206|nr:xanthine dehydrogenase family protein molybdopterin-binding subunit [Nioella nitratireducens]